MTPSNEYVTTTRYKNKIDSACLCSLQVCRAAYEMMQTRHADASSLVRSLDDSYRVPAGANSHYHVTVISHKARNKREIDLRVGDQVVVTSNQLNGLSRGRNMRTNRRGVFPSFKVQDTVDAVEMPTYPELRVNNN